MLWTEGAASQILTDNLMVVPSPEKRGHTGRAFPPVPQSIPSPFATASRRRLRYAAIRG